MSLYNLIAGKNPSTQQLLELLNLTEADFGRFRDVYIEDNFIVVHTRCGGGNREDYEDMFDTMLEHPWYDHDSDQAFDNTYADIYFRIPDDDTRSLVGLLDKGITPSDVWDTIIPKKR